MLPGGPGPALPGKGLPEPEDLVTHNGSKQQPSWLPPVDTFGCPLSAGFCSRHWHSGLRLDTAPVLVELTSQCEGRRGNGMHVTWLVEASSVGRELPAAPQHCAWIGPREAHRSTESWVWPQGHTPTGPATFFLVFPTTAPLPQCPRPSLAPLRGSSAEATPSL